MPTITITIPEDLSTQLEPYRGNLDDLLRIGLREIKIEQSLALFKKGDLSLWKAARLAGISLREMMQYAVAQGLRIVRFLHPGKHFGSGCTTVGLVYMLSDMKIIRRPYNNLCRNPQ